MNAGMSTVLGASTSMWGAVGQMPTGFSAARVRPLIVRRGKRETMAMRVALAVGGPRIARPRTFAHLCREMSQPARRLAGLGAAAAVIVVIETTLSVLSR